MHGQEEKTQHTNTQHAIGMEKIGNEKKKNKITIISDKFPFLSMKYQQNQFKFIKVHKIKAAS